jgi:hemerythrin-like domain-containing protein
MTNMKITEILMAEHAVFHNLFDHIEATVPQSKTLSEVKSLGLIMGKMMAPHSRTEDDLFIEPLEHCFDQLGQKETFHHEHEMIDQELEKVQKARNLRSAREILLSAVTASRDHFDKEERIVFPMAERILKTRTLNELGVEWFKKRDSKLRQPK